MSFRDVADRDAAEALRGRYLFAPTSSTPPPSEGKYWTHELIGSEVALEGLLTGGRLRVLAIFDKPDPLDGPFFEETLYVTPSRHPAGVQSELAAAVAAAARAMGLAEGPVHAELRYNARGPWLLELAARSIGGLCSRALRFGTGLSLEELILRHALDLDQDLEREARAAGVMMIPIPRGGILREVHGMASARLVRASSMVLP